MSNSLLYFPYINVPNDSWTIKSILYWDKVGAIVPHIYKDNPDRLEKNMRALVEAELVQQVFPYNYTYRIPNFDEAFIELTRQSDFNLQQKRIDFRNGLTSRLHVQKFGDRLLSELRRMGIARKESWEWYHVESRTARLFMMYLATLIAKLDNFTPATDRASNIDFSLQQKGLSSYIQTRRGKFLKDLMPYPIEPDIAKLKKFKNKYHKQLKAFRNNLEQTILEVTAIRDREQRERLYQLKLEEITAQKEEVYAKLNESKVGQVVFGTLFGLSGAGIGFVTGNSPLGLFGLGNAVYSAFQGYDRKGTLNSNFSYLALIDKKFG